MTLLESLKCSIVGGFIQGQVEEGGQTFVENLIRYEDGSEALETLGPYDEFRKDRLKDGSTVGIGYRGKLAFLVSGGKELGPYDSCMMPFEYLADDKPVFRTSRDGNSIVVCDGIEHLPVKVTRKEGCGERRCVSYKRHGKFFVMFGGHVLNGRDGEEFVIGGKETGPFNKIFVPKHVGHSIYAVVGRRGKDEYLSYDGIECGPFDRIDREPIQHGPGLFRAERGDSTFMIVGGVEFGPYTRVLGHGCASGKWIYVFERDGHFFASTDGVEEVGPYLWLADQGHICLKRNGLYGILCGSEIGPFENIHSFRWAGPFKNELQVFVGVMNDESFVIVNGVQEYGPFEEVSALDIVYDYSASSGLFCRVVFQARCGDRWFAVVDGEEFPYGDSRLRTDKIVIKEGMIVFSAVTEQGEMIEQTQVLPDKASH